MEQWLKQVLLPSSKGASMNMKEKMQWTNVRCIFSFSSLWVELEGIEPSSKRGNNMFSTCLSPTWIFEWEQDRSHRFSPYPLRLHRKHEATNDYFRLNCTTLPEHFGTTVSEWCLVSAPCAEIKPVIYYTSIRQRERSCFRQIIVESCDYSDRLRSTACLHTFSTRCQIQSAPKWGIIHMQK